MYGIQEESLAFLEAWLTGMAVYGVYLCIRLFRRIVVHTLSAVAIEDIFFWLGTAVYVFVQIHHTTSGSIRWYFILGVVFGSLFFAKISKIPGKLQKKMYDKRRGNSEKTVEETTKKR